MFLQRFLPNGNVHSTYSSINILAFIFATPEDVITTPEEVSTTLEEGITSPDEVETSNLMEIDQTSTEVADTPVEFEETELHQVEADVTPMDEGDPMAIDEALNSLEMEEELALGVASALDWDEEACLIEDLPCSFR